MSKKYPADKCCVVGCKNNNLNSPGTKFYCFSTRDYKQEQTMKWIKAVRRLCADGSMWKPNTRSRICSRHFVGNKKSDHPLSPSFIPTIFPAEYYGPNSRSEMSLINAEERFVRAQKRATKKSAISTYCQSESGSSANPNLDPFEMDILPRCQDQAIQVYFPEEPSELTVFVCNRICENHICHAETQVRIPPSSHTKKVVEKNTLNKCYVDKKVGPDPTDGNKNSLLKCSEGFHGFQSLTEEQELIDLAGVNYETFHLLLNHLKDCKGNKITRENRLLIFLIKMRVGLTYSSIGVLFGVHQLMISRIFHSTLHILVQACKNFVQWPSKETIQATMPMCFKENYPNCRVIIDCTEFRIEPPAEVSQRVFFFSDNKKDFTLKILVGCTPNGLISFVSKCYGGRTTDAQITNLSGILNLLESGDLILAGKGSSTIKTSLDDSDKGVAVVIPSSVEQVDETQKVASSQIHIERIIERIKSYRIMSKFAISELPYVNNIVFMTCVLINLQPPVLKNEINDE